MKNVAITSSIIKLHSVLAAMFLLASVYTAQAGASCGSVSGVSGNVSSITLGTVDCILRLASRWEATPTRTSAFGITYLRTREEGCFHCCFLRTRRKLQPASRDATAIR